MDIKNFRTLRKIIELGSYTKAAQALDYAQSTVTFHIQSLEDYYGLPIFNRIGKTIELTDFGKLLSVQAELLLNTYDTIENFSNNADIQRSILRIGAPESLMLHRLTGIIREFKSTYPQVEIIIYNDLCPHLRDKLHTQDLDIAFLMQPEYMYGQLTTILLQKEEMCFVAPPGYKGEDFLPDDSQMILYTEKECDYRQLFSAYLKSKNFYPTNILETGSVEAIKNYIYQGLGISFLPYYAVQADEKENKLRTQIYPTEAIFYTQLVYHKKKWLNPALKAFIDLCVHHASTWDAAH